MAKHIQRKRFAGPQAAREAAIWFQQMKPAGRDAAVSTRMIEDKDGVWLLVTAEGSNIVGNEPAQPGYELVGRQP